MINKISSGSWQLENMNLGKVQLHFIKGLALLSSYTLLHHEVVCKQVGGWEPLGVYSEKLSSDSYLNTYRTVFQATAEEQDQNSAAQTVLQRCSSTDWSTWSRIFDIPVHVLALRLNILLFDIITRRQLNTTKYLLCSWKFVNYYMNFHYLLRSKHPKVFAALLLTEDTTSTACS